MSSESVPAPISATAPGTTASPDLPHVGEVAGVISDRIAASVSLGIVLVDAGPLASVERRHGGDAHQHVLQALGHEVRSAISDHVSADDLVAIGETGRSELVLVLFRHGEEGNFYGNELPNLRRTIRRWLERHGNRAVYPHLRSLPELSIGLAAAIPNANLAPQTQLGEALREARGDAELEARLAARSRRERFVRLILEREVFSVYEPIVDVHRRTVFGYEALARGPEGTPLHAPVAMFERAIEENLVFQLDCLCRRSALEGALHLPPGTKLFLNMRPTAVHDPSFKPEALIRTLEHTHLAPSDLVFEISEQESIENFSVFREVRDYYGNLGFQIALDDTGAGYASLEAVMELSPEFIKVDRAFISGIDQDPARRELLRAISTVADSIGARIIGEGLDTLEELSTLGELGIPYGQGWLFGKPTPLGVKS